MKHLIQILAIGLFAYTFSDISSPGFLRGLLFPVLFGFCVLALMCWLAFRVFAHAKRDRHSHGDGGSGGYSSSDSGHGCSGSDSGGGDCGGGGD